VWLSTIVRARNRRPSYNASQTKSIDQHSFAAPASIRSTRWAARACRRGLFLRRLSPSFWYSR
jgi:hypothetical protein